MFQSSVVSTPGSLSEEAISAGKYADSQEACPNALAQLMAVMNGMRTNRKSMRRSMSVRLSWHLRRGKTSTAGENVKLFRVLFVTDHGHHYKLEPVVSHRCKRSSWC